MKRCLTLLLALLLALTAGAASAETGGYTAIRDTYAAETGWGEPLLTEAIDLEDSETVLAAFLFTEGMVALYGINADGAGECTAWLMSYPDQLANMYILCDAFDTFSLLCDGHFTLLWSFGEAAEGVITTAEDAAEYAEALRTMLDAAQNTP